MSINKQNPYDVEFHIGEIYDEAMSSSDDVDLIKELLIKNKCKDVLEPFCGTGRILLPLAEEGFQITGIDGSEVMLSRLRDKLELKSDNIKNKVTTIKADLTEYTWPSGCDAVILGANCFFELAELEEQEKVLKYAYDSVKKGGYIFIDSDSIEDELPDSWCNVGVENQLFPSGICEDGVELKGYAKPLYVDKKNKIWKAQRRVEVYKNNEMIGDYAWEQQKHPIGYSEIMDIVNRLNLTVISVWGDIKERKPYTKGDGRVTLWLQK